MEPVLRLSEEYVSSTGSLLERDSTSRCFSYTSFKYSNVEKMNARPGTWEETVVVGWIVVEDCQADDLFETPILLDLSQLAHPLPSSTHTKIKIRGLYAPTAR